MFFPPGLPPDVAIEYVNFMNKMRKKEEAGIVPILPDTADPTQGKGVSMRFAQVSAVGASGLPYEEEKAEVKQPIPKTFGGLMSYGMYMSYLANQKKN